MSCNRVFRGYCQELGRWMYGSYVDGYIISEVVEANEELILIGDWRPVIAGSVGQAIGLNDVTGKPIFEGDYVEVHDSYNNRSFNGVIEYKDASYAVVNEESSNYRLMDYDLKIISKEVD